MHKGNIFSITDEKAQAEDHLADRGDSGPHQVLDELIPVEICFSASWELPGDLFYARLVTLPRTDEIVELPERPPGLYRVTAVRHRSATPLGGKARVQVLVTALASNP